MSNSVQREILDKMAAFEVEGSPLSLDVNEERTPQNQPSSSSPKSSLKICETVPKKKVSFAANTIIHEEDNIASSIPYHQYVRTVGHTQYKIEVAIYTRYSVRILGLLSYL